MSSLDIKFSASESLTDITLLNGVYNDPEKKSLKLELLESSGNNFESSGTEEIQVPVVSLSEVEKQDKSEIANEGFFQNLFFCRPIFADISKWAFYSNQILVFVGFDRFWDKYPWYKSSHLTTIGFISIFPFGFSDFVEFG